MVFYCTRYADVELPDHLHDLYEIVYIHQGSGRFFIDQTFYDKKAGDLFLIPGNTVHRAFPSSTNPIISTSIFFAPTLFQAISMSDGYNPLRIFELAQISKEYKLQLLATTKHKVSYILEEMGKEYNSKKPGYQQALWLQLHQLLLELFRNPSQKQTNYPTIGYVPSWLQDTLQYINVDPVQCGSLTYLSAKALVSPGHFSRVFKKYTGMNVSDYVITKRITKAKQLLLTTEETIETIALQCGFQGMRHFYQMFKRLTGVTPKTYRIQMNAIDLNTQIKTEK